MKFSADITRQFLAGTGREWNVGGKQLQCMIEETGIATVRNYDNSYPGGDGYKLVFTITYQI